MSDTRILQARDVLAHGGLRGAAVVVTAALAAAWPSAAHASAWEWLGDQEPVVTFNPCTLQETSLLLQDVEVLVTGGVDNAGHEGIKFRGDFVTGDGFSGSFRDQDQDNEVPNLSTDNVFTQLVLFEGADATHRRIGFTSVLQVVIRDDVPVVLWTTQSARCVGAG